MSNVVFYDGVCALCNRSVQLLIRLDRRRVLHYAPLQGETFARLAGRVELPPDLDSLVYVRGLDAPAPEVFVRSGGTLQILRDVGGFWRAVSWLRIVPRPLRDAVYRWIARHRYKWFGRYDECRLPSPKHAGQLLP